MDPLLHELRRIPLHREAARQQLAAFLSGHGLRLDSMLEGYFGIFRDDVLVAGAGYDRNIIKCVAVDDESRGEGLLGSLISHIVAERLTQGMTGLIVFTKPVYGKQFESLGFSPVASTTDAVLLVNDRRDLVRYLSSLSAMRCPDSAGGLVMNCNPFTHGHRHLVETASQQCERVFLFVVEENASVFPFSVRRRLVEEGVCDMPNVVVVPGGAYIISSATFPTYFIKEASGATRAAAELDAAVFGLHIAPAAGIAVRFVGEEPVCQATALYNKALLAVLPPLGVRVETIERLCHDGEAISASRVRALLAAGDVASTRALVPDSTYRYLASDDAKPVLQHLASSNQGSGIRSPA